MPFPTSAQNNQLYTLNGIVYVYNSTKNTWTKVAPTSANIVTTDTANVVSNIASVSTTTGALQVAGGAGIAGNVFAGAVYTNSYFYANGASFGGSLGYTGSTGTTGFTGSAGAQGPAGGYTGSIGFTGSAATASTVLFSWNSLVDGNAAVNGGTLLGNAVYDSAANGVKLVSATNNQSGAVYWSSPTIDWAGNLVIEASVGATGGGGADGSWLFFGSNIASPAGTSTNGFRIYTDFFNKRFYIQTQTAASTINFSPATYLPGGVEVYNASSLYFYNIEVRLYTYNAKRKADIYLNDSFQASFDLTGWTAPGNLFGLTAQTGGVNANIYTRQLMVVQNGAVVGSTGYTGSTGFTGSTGTGFTGSAGTGFTGSTGTTGFTGSFGTTGFVGSIGFTGSTGIGFAGSAGFTGSTGTGFTGSAGAAGAVGFTGSAGGGGGGGNGYTGSAGTPGTLASGQVTNTFTGDGTTTAFTLSVAPVGKDAVTVNIDGVTQQRSGYTVGGFVLTLDEAPLSGEVIEVTIATYGTTNFVARTYTGDGVTSNFAVTLGTTVNSVIVTENGVVQTPTTDYTITGNVLTILGGAPAAGTTVGIREIPAGAVGGNSVYSRTAITATANQTSFAVAYTVGFLEVYFNGALLNAVDYTATNGSTVVLTDPAADGDIVEFITYNVVPVTAVPVATFNSTNLTANLAITAGYSAVSVGPINIANGVTISIADGQKWVIL